MEKTSEQLYTDLLRQLGSPTIVEPETLVGYLREVERMHSMGRITDWQFQRAREAYADTIDRDARQDVAEVSPTVIESDEPAPRAVAANPDPITGTAGAPPLGTGIGAVLGGVAAGAAIGSVVGPAGTFLGGAVGAVIGGLAGKGVAEIIEPTAEVPYSRSPANHTVSARMLVAAPVEYADEYGPAYAYGVSARALHDGDSFDAVETEIASGWDLARGESTLAWDRARPAAREGWEHVGR